MNREELQKYVGVTGYSMGQVEKDYFQHIVLNAISRKVGGLLVFKGGTALQKTGFVQRFSEDLDFTLRDDLQMEKLEATAVNAVETYNYRVDIDNTKDDERTMGFRMKIQGLLYANRVGMCTIRIEVSKREKILLVPERKELAPPYSDILPYILDIMRPEEILAEKVRAVSTRQKARDLYDIHKLLVRGVKIDVSLANEKLRYYSLDFDTVKFIKKCRALEPGWEKELQSLLEDVPLFEDVLNTVAGALDEHENS